MCCAGCAELKIDEKCKESSLLSYISSTLEVWNLNIRFNMMCRRCAVLVAVGPEIDHTAGKFFHRDMVMKIFLQPFSLFKKKIWQLMAQECSLSIG